MCTFGRMANAIRRVFSHSPSSKGPSPYLVRFRRMSPWGEVSGVGWSGVSCGGVVKWSEVECNGIMTTEVLQQGQSLLGNPNLPDPETQQITLALPTAQFWIHADSFFLCQIIQPESNYKQKGINSSRIPASADSPTPLRGQRNERLSRAHLLRQKCCTAKAK